MARNHAVELWIEWAAKLPGCLKTWVESYQFLTLELVLVISNWGGALLTCSFLNHPVMLKLSESFICMVFVLGVHVEVTRLRKVALINTSSGCKHSGLVLTQDVLAV